MMHGQQNIKFSGMGCQVSGNPWALEFEFGIRFLREALK
jgi:hypothetical protein